MPPTRLQRIGLLLGPLVFFVFYLLPAPAGLSKPGMMVAACTCWMAIWWLTEAAPIYLTAMLPLILYPIAGVMDIKDAAPPYGSWLVWLLFCGFSLAAAIEKWGLHKRIALRIILATGTAPDRILLGFMLATAFLSMWISNTATAVMMVPIGVAVAMTLSGMPGGDDDNFAKALLLSIAYSASIGGLSSLIGTPTNLIFANAASELLQIEISFQKWLVIGLPIGIGLLLICWIYLSRFAFSFRGQSGLAGKQIIEEQYRALGPASSAEKRVGLVFGIVALGWISRDFLLSRAFPFMNDTSIGLIGVILLFVLPSGTKQYKNSRATVPLLDWPTVQNIPWGVLLLIGGGLAIAEGFKATDLASWIGSQLGLLKSLPFFLLLLAIVAAVNFLTEITSNMATVSILMPILAVTGQAVEVDPMLLMVAATLASGCAFMLPIATPPNAVVFGTKYLRIQDMAKAGLWMNILSILFLSLMVYYFMPLVW